MGTFIIELLLKLVTSKAAETFIAVGVSKLLKSKTSGIGKELATTMINGIAESKHNPTTPELFANISKALGK